MRTIWALMVLTSTFVSPSPGYDRITGKPFASRSRAIAQHGMAATSQPLATQVAIGSA